MFGWAKDWKSTCKPYEDIAKKLEEDTENERIAQIKKKNEELHKEVIEYNKNISYKLGDKVKSKVIDGLVGNVTLLGCKYVYDFGTRYKSVACFTLTTISWLNNIGDISTYSDSVENFERVEQ